MKEDKYRLFKANQNKKEEGEKEEDNQGTTIKIGQNLRSAANLERAIERKKNEVNFLENMCEFLARNTYR